MEHKLTLSSLFPLEIQSALKHLSVHQCALNTPLLILNSDLDKNNSEHLCKESKLLVVGVTKALAKLTPQQRCDYATLDSTLRQNPILETTQDSELNFSTQLLKDSNTFTPENLLKNPLIKKFVDNSPELSALFKQAEKSLTDAQKSQVSNTQNYDHSVTPEEVKNWFSGLVKHSNTILDHLNPEFYTELIAWLCAHFPELLKKDSVPLINLIILSYPSPTRSHFVLTNVKINAWVQQTKDVVSHGKKIGISGDFIQKNFYPRASVLNGLKQETVEKAASELPSLFK